MTTLQKTKLGIVAITILGMFLSTSQFRSSFNTTPSYFEQLNGQQISVDTLAQVYAEFDILAAESLYRKIWTYNILIFLSGTMLLVFLKEEKE